MGLWGWLGSSGDFSFRQERWGLLLPNSCWWLQDSSLWPLSLPAPGPYYMCILPLFWIPPSQLCQCFLLAFVLSFICFTDKNNPIWDLADGILISQLIFIPRKKNKYDISSPISMQQPSLGTSFSWQKASGFRGPRAQGELSPGCVCRMCHEPSVSVVGSSHCSLWLSVGACWGPSLCG